MSIFQDIKNQLLKGKKKTTNFLNNQVDNIRVGMKPAQGDSRGIKIAQGTLRTVGGIGQGLGKFAVDTARLGNKLNQNKYINLINPNRGVINKLQPQINQGIQNSSQFLQKNAPTSIEGKIGSGIGYNVPAILLPATKGFTAARIASPAARLAANSLLRGGENAVYGAAMRGAKGEKITLRNVASDVGTGALFNAALSPFEIFGKAGLKGRQGAIGEFVQKKAEQSAKNRVEAPIDDLIYNLSKSQFSPHVNEFLKNSPVTKNMTPGVRKLYTEKLTKPTDPEEITSILSTYIDTHIRKNSPIKTNHYQYTQPGTSPGFISAGGGRTPLSNEANKTTAIVNAKNKPEVVKILGADAKAYSDKELSILANTRNPLQVQEIVDKNTQKLVGIPKAIQDIKVKQANGEQLNFKEFSQLKNFEAKTPQLSVKNTPEGIVGGVGTKTKTAPSIVPETTPRTNTGLVVKPSETIASNLENSQPTSLIRKAGKETPTPQLEANKGLSFDNSKPQTETFYNVDNLNISNKAKAGLKKEISKNGAKIEKVIGKKLTNEEVIKTAENTSKILDTTVTREQTKAKIAANLKLRQKIAAKAQQGFKSKKEADDFADLWLKDKAAGADLAKQLQARRIKANQNDQEGIDIILDAIYRNNKNADEISKAMKKYDLTDPEDLNKFYREFVKPNAGDWIDALRYNSMLSSPTTHLVNISSNIQGAGIIEPLTKTVTGSLDSIRAALTGTPRQSYAGEGVQYSIGYLKNLGNASRKLWNVMSGKETSTMQGIQQIPLTEKGTAGRVAEDSLKFTGRLLQGMDEFFTTAGEGGNLRSLAYRESKGVKVANPGQLAFNQAKEAIFNSPFNLEKEGYVLKALEWLPSKIGQMTRADNAIVRTIGKFTFPFVRIGSNLTKSGVQYSPFGISTLPGASNKTEQLAKFVIGSASALGAATLLGQDRLTWAEPISENQKNAFRDAGKIPYAVKVGDKWISYSKLHPALSFNFALIAALDDSIKNKRLSDDQADTIMQTAAKFGKFYADQSYLRNIGDFVSATQGSVSGWSKYASNYGQQLIPLRALMGYVERIVDPYQRQVDSDGSILEKQMQYVMAQIPGFANKVPVRTNEMGEPIMNQNRAINAVSPARVSTENPQGVETYNRIMNESAANKQTIDINKANKKGQQLDPGKTGEIETGIYRLKDGTIKYKTADGTLEKVDSVEKARSAIEKDTFDKSGESYQQIGDNFYSRNKDNSVKVTPMSEIADKQSGLTYTLSLEKAKRNNDIKGWFKLQDDQLAKLDKEYKGLDKNNPLDAIRMTEIENKSGDILTEYNKLKSYGGFTKPKKAKALKAPSITSTSAPKISLAKPVMKALKVSVSNGGFKRPTAGAKGGSIRLKKGI